MIRGRKKRKGKRLLLLRHRLRHALNKNRKHSKQELNRKQSDNNSRKQSVNSNRKPSDSNSRLKHKDSNKKLLPHKLKSFRMKKNKEN